MPALTFPSSPVNGQTVTIGDVVYIYRSAITAWDMLENPPLTHATSHQLGGSDQLLLDQSQVSGLALETVPTRQYVTAASVLQNIPTTVHPAENLLRSAAWWIDANHSTASGQAPTNLGWGGSILNPRVGSSTSADTNDPKHLAYTGDTYAYLPGLNGNYLSVPDESALDITGDIDLRVKVALDDWTPSAQQALLSKWNTTGNQRSYLLRVETDGTLTYTWSNNGTASTTVTTTTTVVAADGAVKWVRATHDVDNGASGNDVKFYTSDDGVSWGQLGTTRTTAGVTTIYASTSVVEVGSINAGTGNPAAGKFYRATVKNSIDGISALDIDTNTILSGSAATFTALTGQTVTVNRATSGLKTSIVTSPLWLFGTEDYMEVPPRWISHTGTHYAFIPGTSGNYLSAPDAAPFDIVGNIDIRGYVALEDWTPAAENTILSKAGAAGQRSYGMSVTTAGLLKLFWSANGTDYITKTSTLAVGSVDGTAKWIRATLDVDNGSSGNDVKFYTSDDGSTWVQLGTTVVTAGVTSIFSSTAPIEIGSVSGGTLPMSGRVFRTQVFNEIEGVSVFDANINVNVPTASGNVNSFTATTGGTVTVNRSGTDIRTAIITYSGYLQPNSEVIQPSTYSLLDFGATESFTVVAVTRQTNYTASQTIISKKAGTANSDIGWLIRNSTSTPAVSMASISDGTVAVDAVSAASRADRGLSVVSIVRNTSTDVVTSYVNGTAGTPLSDTTTTTLSTSQAMRVGRLAGTGTGYSDMEFIAGAVFRRALTATEITLLSNYYAGRVA
jgi:hypothetical protein